ncbi:MAG: ATP-binding protein, partial [Pseudomonadota bacterium]|nr:ATP-binding protein [Pseudomonadota bacterium]
SVAAHAQTCHLHMLFTSLLHTLAPCIPRTPQTVAITATDDSVFLMAMACAGIGMAIISVQGLWVEVNPALAKLLGVPVDALIGCRVDALTHPDDLTFTEQVLDRLQDGGQEVVEVEMRCLHADGHVIEVVVNSALMREDGGRADHVIAQLRDVTAQRHAERSLRDLNATLEQRALVRTQELEAANLRLESFVRGVSHDLRAPLRAIEGFATQLARSTEGQLDATAQEHLQRIRAASTRMGGLIEGLLELARISRAVLTPAQVDASMLAEWTLAELQDANPQRSADVQVQPGLEVIGDENLLRMLLRQLLDNAWRFSANRPLAWIRVEGERRGDSLHLSIRDRGIGFDMAYAPKLFEPFQRLHGSDEGAGNGIGLTIAQQVAMRHGGRVSAQAEPDRGACFHVELVDLKDQNIQHMDA